MLDNLKGFSCICFYLIPRATLTLESIILFFSGEETGVVSNIKKSGGDYISAAGAIWRSSPRPTGLNRIHGQFCCSATGPCQAWVEL